MAWHGETLECLPKHVLAFATTPYITPSYPGREVFHAQLATTCVEVGEKIKVLKGSECRAKDLATVPFVLHLNKLLQSPLPSPPSHPAPFTNT